MKGRPDEDSDQSQGAGTGDTGAGLAVGQVDQAQLDLVLQDDMVRVNAGVGEGDVLGVQVPDRLGDLSRDRDLVCPGEEIICDMDLLIQRRTLFHAHNDAGDRFHNGSHEQLQVFMP